MNCDSHNNVQGVFAAAHSRLVRLSLVRELLYVLSLIKVNSRYHHVAFLVIGIDFPDLNELLVHRQVGAFEFSHWLSPWQGEVPKFRHLFPPKEVDYSK